MKIGVLGCGKMGTAWVAGIIRGGAAAPAEVFGVDGSQTALRSFVDATGAQSADSLRDLADSDVVLLCTKPNDLLPALQELGAHQKKDEGMLVISIAAGVTISALEAVATDSIRIVRVMPNTPALVGQGAAAYCLGSRATVEDGALVAKLLETVGMASEFPEKLMNAVTGLSGSGPAYVYLIIEALADGGVRCGLPRDQALQLATQTVLGAAAMVKETGEHPAKLKDMVTSPGGTTIAGLATMEKLGVRSAMIEAVTAADERARELGA